MPKRSCTLPTEALEFREWSLKQLAAMGYPREALETHKMFDAEIMAQRLKNHANSWNAAHSLVAENAVEHFTRIDAALEAAVRARDERRRRREGAIDQEYSALGRAIAMMVRSARYGHHLQRRLNTCCRLDSYRLAGGFRRHDTREGSGAQGADEREDRRYSGGGRRRHAIDRRYGRLSTRTRRRRVKACTVVGCVRRCHS